MNWRSLPRFTNLSALDRLRFATEIAAEDVRDGIRKQLEALRQRGEAPGETLISIAAAWDVAATQ